MRALQLQAAQHGSLFPVAPVFGGSNPEAKLKQLQDENDTLKSAISDRESKVSDLESKVSDLEDLESRISDLESK